MTAAERPEFKTPHPLPRMVAETLDHELKIRELSFRLYQSFDEALNKYGEESEVVRRIGAQRGLIGSGHNETFLILTSPDIWFERTIGLRVIPIRMFITHEISGNGRPQILVNYAESRPGNRQFSFLTMSRDAATLDKDNNAFTTEEQFKDAKDLYISLALRFGEQSEEVDLSTRKTNRYPARVVEGSFGSSGYLKFTEEDQYEPL